MLASMREGRRLAIVFAVVVGACRDGGTAAQPAASGGQAAAAAAAPISPVERVPKELRINGKAGAIQAFLWQPDGPGPFPAIVYNHGSEQEPIVGTRGKIGSYFAANGYVVLFPYRRGSGASQGAYWRDRAMLMPGDRQRAAVDALVEENDDVVSAIEWLREQPFVVHDAIAVAGCSFGGIQSMLTAERNVPGVRAIVDFAGGAMSWASSAAVRERLVEAAGAARLPIFFVQAENDFNTEPSKVLAETRRQHGLPYRMTVFPAYGTTNMDGHGKFCLNGTDVWGPAVLDFLRSPAQP